MDFRAVFLAGALLITTDASVVAQQSMQSKQIPAVELRNLLRSPNGLEKAANRSGDFTTSKEERVFVDPSLAGIVRSSSVVIVGTLLSSQSELSEDGDSINTNYKFRPEEVLKGSLAASEILVVGEGGKVQFRNGTTAEIKTIEWMHLNAGDEYLLCLTQRGDKYFFAFGFAGIFRLHQAFGSENKVLSLASFSHRPFRVAKQAESHTPDSLIATVRQGISKAN